MNVLHLSAGNLYGGVETLLTTLARLRHLAPEMEPQFGLCYRGQQWDELVAAGVVVNDLGPARVSRPHSVWRARRRLRAVLASTRPDVVITHNSWPHLIFAPVVRAAGCRLGITVHGPLTGQHWVERWALRTRPDLVIANSRYTAAAARGAFPGVPVSVWYLPVAPPPPLANASRADVRAEFGTSVDAFVILQASRLDAFKGHAVLIDALRRLAPGKWECWVVGGAQQAGEEKYLARLRAAVLESGLDQQVRFLGQRRDIARLLCAADIFCQPNTGPEPFGIVFVEALYAGLPVVTSGFGGAAEIVTEDCGVVIQPGDAGALARVLAILMRDPEHRRRLGAAGPARARQLCEPARQLTGFAQHLAQDHR